MLRIALTGPSGAGKGYVSEILQKYGVPTLDTDEVVHALYADLAFARGVQAAFDAPVLSPDGKVDRRALGAVVFSDEVQMKKLQSVVYPRVRGEISAFLDASEKSGCRAAVVDAPQLFEAGFEGDFDVILCVFAPKTERLRRVRARDGITRSAALARFDNQMAGRDYIKRAHAVIRNGKGDDVEGQIEAFLRAREVLS